MKEKRFDKKEILGTVFALVGIILGIFVQFMYSYYIGLVLVIVSAVLNWKPTVSNRPKKLGRGEWLPTEEKKINEIEKIINISKKKSVKKMGFFAYIILAVILCVIIMAFVSQVSVFTHDNILIKLYVYLVVFMIPFAVSGKVEYYFEPKLNYAINQQKDIEAPEGWHKEYSLFMDREHNIPLDMKIILKSDNMPKEFLGVQVSTAINNGPNGECPYTYCVILAQKSLCMTEKFNIKNVSDDFAKLCVISNETKAGDDVSVLVVRMDGYETKQSLVNKTVLLSVKIAESLV